MSVRAIDKPALGHEQISFLSKCISYIVDYVPVDMKKMLNVLFCRDICITGLLVGSAKEKGDVSFRNKLVKSIPLP